MDITQRFTTPGIQIQVKKHENMFPTTIGTLQQWTHKHSPDESPTNGEKNPHTKVGLQPSETMALWCWVDPEGGPNTRANN